MSEAEYDEAEALQQSKSAKSKKRIGLLLVQMKAKNVRAIEIHWEENCLMKII